MKSIRMLLVMPSHGSIGGIEHFHMAVASFLKEDSSFALRMLIKLVGESEIDANLSAFLEDLGVPHQTYRRPIDVPTKLLAWPHIVYSQNPIPEVCLFAKMLRKKLVITHHNWLKRPYSVQGLRWRIASSLADIKWYNSNFVRKTWDRSPASPRSEAFPTVSRLPMKMSPLAERRGFTFISRWIENKGVETLLEAYAGAQIDRRQWPLTMMGTGPLLTKIRQDASYASIEGVRIVGFVSDQEKFDHIAKAKWHVTPPSTFEDMGLTPLEARSVGVPCIVSNDGGLPEVCGPGSLIVERGQVAALRAAIEAVTKVPEEEYRRICAETFEELSTSIRGAEFYRNAFRSLS